jgi:hypothetical protein
LRNLASFYNGSPIRFILGVGESVIYPAANSWHFSTAFYPSLYRTLEYNSVQMLCIGREGRTRSRGVEQQEVAHPGEQYFVGG